MISNVQLKPLSKGYTKKQKKDWLDELADWPALTQDLAEALRPLLAALILEVGRQAFLDLGADPDAFDAAEAAVAAYPVDRALKVAVAMNDETKKQLRAEASQSADADESQAELLARIEKVFGAASTYRAARASETEIVGGQGFADVHAWKQSGLVKSKEWYTAEDELVCPFCRSMDGIIAGLDEAFFEQGDTLSAGGETLKVGFGDIQHPPLHVKCRCYLLDVRI